MLPFGSCDAIPGRRGGAEPGASDAPGRDRSLRWVGVARGRRTERRPPHGGTDPSQCRRTGSRKFAARGRVPDDCGPALRSLSPGVRPAFRPRQRGGEVGGQRRAHVDRLAAGRMREREPRRVQELAPQPVPAGAAVLRVAGDGMADREQVRADLVRPPRLEPDPQQRVLRQRALDLEVGDGRRAARPCRTTSASARAGRGRAARRSCRAAPAAGPRPARGTRARGRAARARP